MSNAKHKDIVVFTRTTVVGVFLQLNRFDFWIHVLRLQSVRVYMFVFVDAYVHTEWMMCYRVDGCCIC